MLWTISGLSVLAAQGPPVDSPSIDAEMVNRFVKASRLQRTVLRNKPTQVQIIARLLKSKRQSQLRAIRRVSDQGEIGYDILQASGDDGLRRQVITRYMAAESQSRDADARALTPLNYKFRLKAVIDRLGRRIHVFQLTPRQKREGLFKGELWVDEATGMPVRESGQFVKTPNPFLKRLTFIRNFELRDGLAFPTQDEITIDVRFWGRAALNIDFTHN